MWYIIPKAQSSVWHLWWGVNCFQTRTITIFKELAVHPDGSVYVCTWTYIHHITSLCTHIETILDHGELHYPMAICVNPSGDRLYVSDWNGSTMTVSVSATRSVVLCLKSKLWPNPRFSHTCYVEISLFSDPSFPTSDRLFSSLTHYWIDTQMRRAMT